MHNPSGCAVDIHTHVVPENFPPYARAAAGVAWPSMVPAHACHRHVMLSGKVYRTVPESCWDVRARIVQAEPVGVQQQVLSPMPELLSYWLDGEDGAVLSRFINEEIARMVSREPGRFFGLGAVPLQDLDRAIAELEYIVTQLKLSGVEIGTNVNGMPIGDPKLAPFFEAAEKLGAAIFVHPLRPAGMERLVGPPNLEQLVAFPVENGLAAASLVTGGMLSRFPKLRIAFSHGGGSFAMVLPRLQHGWELFDALKAQFPMSPTEAARKMFYDSLVYDEQALRHVIERFGKTQVCVGTDYPFVIEEKDPVGRINALGLDDSTRMLLLRDNALRWLNASQ